MLKKLHLQTLELPVVIYQCSHLSCSVEVIDISFLVYNTTYLSRVCFSLFNKCVKQVLNPIIVQNCFGVSHPNHSARQLNCHFYSFPDFQFQIGCIFSKCNCGIHSTIQDISSTARYYFICTSLCTIFHNAIVITVMHYKAIVQL